MSLRQVLLIIVLAFWCMNITFHCKIPTDPLPWVSDISVPYRNQIYCNYCGVACVQMWAHLEHNEVSQTEIASFIDLVPMDPGASPYDLERAVYTYTQWTAYFAKISDGVPGAQGDLISSTIEAVKYCVPSIMPFYFGDHAVLIKGYEWMEKADGTPYAIRCFYHDPDGNVGPNQDISAYVLKTFFRPAVFDYWVILGDEEFLINGIFGHDSFVMQGGTYYGGPAVYNPKGLDLDVPMF